MHWPTQSRPTPPAELPFYNLHYLYGCATPSDPTIIWGTEVDAEGLCDYVRLRNQVGEVLISPAHVLLQAVGRALAEFPHLNRRIIRRRLYSFREINVRTISYDTRQNEVEVILVKNADRLSVEQIARGLWKNQRQAAEGLTLAHQDRRLIRRLPHTLLRYGIKAYFWLDRNFRLPSLRLYRINNSPVLVNYLGFAGAPPLRMYKSSCYPDESYHLNVTMGSIERRPVVRGGELCIGQVAPLYVRGDHRITDAYRLAQFAKRLRELLADPAQMEAAPAGPRSVQATVPQAA
jgi:hypothetical protein